MRKTIQWPDQGLHFVGRNGQMKCAGMVVECLGRRVVLRPITSKGRWGRCEIEVPLDDRVLAALVDAIEPGKLKARLFTERFK